jgi:heme-degrading monooxygenase HmoA
MIRREDRCLRLSKTLAIALVAIGASGRARAAPAGPPATKVPAEQGALMQPELMTLGMWRVKPEQQEAFVAAWKRLGEIFSRLPNPPSGKGTLLQSTSDPTLFYSFGPWSSRADVEAMRANPEAQAGIAALKALCTEAVPGSYQVVAHSP